MSAIDHFFSRANLLLDKLDAILPVVQQTRDLDNAVALRWKCKADRSWLEPINHVSQIQLDDLLCIDRQKGILLQNTRQFVHGLPANNILLWGPRGTGKSSLIKAVLNGFRHDGLRLIEVESQHLVDLQEICDLIYQVNARYIIYCDDLSFAANDPGYKALKVILDGSVANTPDNVVIYATSNRRHLIPEYMSENQAASMHEGELHLADATEEKISLSERFGIWLAFHPFNQQQYLRIVDAWLDNLGAPVEDTDVMHKAAVRWALERGSRSGRIAWQFARDWTGKAGLLQLG